MIMNTESKSVDALCKLNVFQLVSILFSRVVYER